MHSKAECAKDSGKESEASVDGSAQSTDDVAEVTRRFPELGERAPRVGDHQRVAI